MSSTDADPVRKALDNTKRVEPDWYRRIISNIPQEGSRFIHEYFLTLDEEGMITALSRNACHVHWPGYEPLYKMYEKALNHGEGEIYAIRLDVAVHNGLQLFLDRIGGEWGIFVEELPGPLPATALRTVLKRSSPRGAPSEYLVCDWYLHNADLNEADHHRLVTYFSAPDLLRFAYANPRRFIVKKRKRSERSIPFEKFKLMVGDDRVLT